MRQVAVRWTVVWVAVAAMVCPPSLLAGAEPASSPPIAAAARDAATASEPPLLSQAWQEMRFANYLKAQKAFEKALAEAPDREAKAEATFGLAMLWQSRPSGANVPMALALYEHIVTEYKDTKAAPWALLSLARHDDLPTYEKDRNVEQARARYRQVLERWPDTAAADEAAFRLAQTYLEHVGDTATEDQGVKILREWLAKRPDNVMAAVMHWHLGGVYKLRKQYREALDHWGAADKAGIPGTEVRAMLCLSAGYIAEHKLKDYALAITWYEKITKEIVRDNRYYVAQMWADGCREKAKAKPAAPSGPHGEAGR